MEHAARWDRSLTPNTHGCSACRVVSWISADFSGFGILQIHELTAQIKVSYDHHYTFDVRAGQGREIISNEHDAGVTSRRPDQELWLVRRAETLLHFEALSLAALVDRPL